MYRHSVRDESGFAARARAAGATGIRRLLQVCFLLAASHGASAAVSCSPGATTCTSAPLVQQARQTGVRHAATAAIATGGLPQLRFEQTSLDFGTVDTGSSGPMLTAVLVNDSDSVSATQLHFEADPLFPLMHQFGSCEGLDLEPGASCSVRIKFAPTAPGPAFGTLTATSAETAEAEAALGGTGGDNYVLYSQPHDWETMPVFWALFATTYSITTAYSSDMADDFLVEDPLGWTVSKVAFEASSFPGRNPPTVPTEVVFLTDDNGLPGTDVMCSTSASTTVRWEPPFNENVVEIALAPACELPPGHYWLQVRFRAPSYSTERFFWGLQFVREPVVTPPVHLNAPIWRQPGGGSGYPGCFAWTAVVPPNCGLEEFQGQTAYGTVFWLVGNVTTPIFADGFER